MRIVPVTEIPKASDVIPVPLDPLMAVYKIAFEMSQLCQSLNGVGLAAVQVGIPWKLFVARTGKNNIVAGYSAFIDCEYKSCEDSSKIISMEGCLSIRKPDNSLMRYQVKRNNKVRVTGKTLVVEPDLKLEDFDAEFDGFYSIVMQHEIDHAAAILISDIGTPVDLW